MTNCITLIALLVLGVPGLSPGLAQADGPAQNIQTACGNERPQPGSFQQTLMTVVESNALPGVLIRFFALTDRQGDIIGLMTHRSDNPRARIYNLCEVRAGMVNFTKDDRDVAILKTPRFDGQRGGQIDFDFLYNGITGSRGMIHFDIVREGARWTLYWDQGQNNSRSESFNYLWMNKNTKFIVGIVGIAWLRPSLIDLHPYANIPVPL